MLYLQIYTLLFTLGIVLSPFILIKMYRLLQWNCRGIHGKLTEFKSLITDFDIVCLQETWLKHKDILLMAGFLSIRQDRPSDQIGGGTAIFCRTDLDPSNMALSGLDRLRLEFSSILVNKISFNNKKLIIVSVYRPDISLGKSRWCLFFDLMKSLTNKFSIIMCGDFSDPPFFLGLLSHKFWGIYSGGCLSLLWFCFS